jgi:hypothetical protein
VSKRVALVALGRSALPTGKPVLTGELADGVTLASVERALAKGGLEFEALPDPKPAKPEPKPEPVRQAAVLPPPVTAPAAVKHADPLAGKSAAEVRSELEQARRRDEVKKDEAAKAKPAAKAKKTAKAAKKSGKR